MQFVYHKEASNKNLIVEGELYKYIFKVRRFDSSKNIFFRNLEDKNIYEYKILSLDRRKAFLELESFKEKIIEAEKKLHIGWCVIEPKSIEKYIASLNELGVYKITFFHCEYSQKQYKPDFNKLRKLLINSSSQCGRSSIIELNICDSLELFLEQNPNSYIFNFSKNNIQQKKESIDTIVVGCEGGFSEKELNKFETSKIVGVKSNLILRSETALCSVASNILS